MVTIIEVSPAFDEEFRNEMRGLLANLCHFTDLPIAYINLFVEGQTDFFVSYGTHLGGIEASQFAEIETLYETLNTSTVLSEGACDNRFTATQPLTVLFYYGRAMRWENQLLGCLAVCDKMARNLTLSQSELVDRLTQLSAYKLEPYLKGARLTGQSTKVI